MTMCGRNPQPIIRDDTSSRPDDYAVFDTKEGLLWQGIGVPEQFNKLGVYVCALRTRRWYLRVVYNVKPWTPLLEEEVPKEFRTIMLLIT